MNSRNEITTENITFLLDRNSYEAKVFNKDKNFKASILFPIFHFKGESQYRDLMNPLLDEGYRIITINFLNKGDRILTFDYYYDIFEQFYNEILLKRKIINKEEIILLGIGVGANLISNMQKRDIRYSKAILISPTNNYKSDYSISNGIGMVKKPTFVMFGQIDKENSVDSRYEIFKKGKNNKNVHFSSYPCTGFYCYYDRMTSFELEKMYRKNNIDVLIGSDRNNQPLFLPTEAKLNELFFYHLFNNLKGIDNPKKILLITETFPQYSLGKGTTIEFLGKELNKLGYETYITGLWRSKDDFSILNDKYIPVLGFAAKKNKNDSRLIVLREFNYVKSARMLAMFGFDYLHLYSDYRMSEVGLELAKITGIKMPYTYHTLWRLYYSKKINEFIKDTPHKFIRNFMRSKVFKQCPLIITQSKISYDIFKSKSNIKNKFKLLITPMNKDNFVFDKNDQIKVNNLRKQYQLNNKKIIGYLNKVSVEYSTYELIEYFGALVEDDPLLTLMLVGTGNATNSLLNYAEKLGISDRVIVVKEVSNEDRKLYYYLFDVFVTNNDFELQGSPYFEAAKSGTPIVAKSNPATLELFKDGENAYIYKDFSTFYDSIKKALYENNKNVIKNATKLISNFDQEKWAKEMVKIYKELNN